MQIKTICYYAPLQFRGMESDHKGNCEYIDEYRVVRVLGAGYSAQVKLAVDSDGKYVAVKQYKHETSTLETLKEELKVMKDLSHENLIRLIAVKEKATNKKANGPQQSCFAIVLEYAGGGELFDFIAETGKFSQKVARTYFHQMMNGLHFMHDKGYAHRDIKPQNLLLTSNFILKLADFGFSCLLRGHDGTGILRTKLGTEGYMAPQIANKNYDGRKTDIFASGVILFIMYAGNPPFERALLTDPYYKLLKQKRFDVFWNAHSRKRLPTFFVEPFKDLVQKMLAFTPSERPTIVEIAKHPWVKGATCSHHEILEEFQERKKKMDLALQKKRIEKQCQNHRRNQNVHNQGYNSRGDEQIEDKEFLEIYNKEKLKGWQPKQMYMTSNWDIQVFHLDQYFILTQIKEYLKEHTLPLFQQDIDSEELIDLEIDELRLSQLKQLQDGIQVKYIYPLEIESHQCEGVLKMSIQIGRHPSNSSLIIHFELLEGNGFYFRRIAREIKKECFP